MDTGLYSSRRRIVWKKLNGFRAVAAFLMATALGAGLFPVAPGTAGTLIGIPLAYWSSDWYWLLRVFLWCGIIGLGSLAARDFDQMMGTQDNQNIVIDEVIGLGITAWTAEQDLKTWIAAFFIFRFFDVIKIPPVRQIDRWSKKKSNTLWSGFGVIADDMVAGFQGLALILLLQGLGIL